jgi:hypothetical protein
MYRCWELHQDAASTAIQILEREAYFGQDLVGTADLRAAPLSDSIGLDQ